MTADDVQPTPSSDAYWDRKNDEVLAVLQGVDQEEGTGRLVEILAAVADDHGTRAALTFAAAITMRIAIEYRSRR